MSPKTKNFLFDTELVEVEFKFFGRTNFVFIIKLYPGESIFGYFLAVKK